MHPAPSVFSGMGSVVPPVIKKHADPRAADEHIAQNAEPVRHLAKDEKAQRGGIEHLRIIIHRDLLGRCADIRLRDAELPDARKHARQQQVHKLPRAHRRIVQQQERQAGQTGERREVKHDPAAVFSARTQIAHERVRSARAQPAERAGQRRERLRIIEARLDDAHTATEGDQNAEHLHEVRLFAQQENRKHDGEKRRELVEHIRVRQIQPADGIEIAQQAQRAEKTPAEQRREVAPLRPERRAAAQHEDDNENKCNKVAEKCLFKRRQIARQLHKHGHERKAERRDEDIDDALRFLTAFLHNGSLDSCKVNLLYNALPRCQAAQSMEKAPGRTPGAFSIGGDERKMRDERIYEFEPSITRSRGAWTPALPGPSWAWSASGRRFHRRP